MAIKNLSIIHVVVVVNDLTVSFCDDVINDDRLTVRCMGIILN